LLRREGGNSLDKEHQKKTGLAGFSLYTMTNTGGERKYLTTVT